MTGYSVKLSSGRSLGYAEYGDPKGKPLFFFHGWPSSRLHAGHLNQEAKRQKVRIISIDRPGFGLSDPKHDRTLLEWPDDVVQLADYLKIKKFAVMGVSGGGPYAAACAYKIPERLTKVGIVVGLAPTYIPGILDEIGFVNRLGWANYQRFPILRDISAYLGWLEAKFSPSNFSSFFVARADKFMYSPEMRNATHLSRKEAFKRGYQPASTDLKLYTNDWGFDLNKIKAKVYLWYGEADKNVSLSMGKYYAQQIPHSVLITYPNEGHFIQVTHAEEILKTLMS